MAAALLLASAGACAAATAASYPLIGSVWWGESIFTASPAQAAKIQLFLAPNFDANAANAMRVANPNALMLTSINAMETTNGAPVVPDSYYLLDVNGNKIQDWPGTPGNFLVNLTNPDVVQFMAQYAAQQLTQTGFNYDGMFFDNVTEAISTVTADCFGNPVQINANYPGPPDLPGVLDAKWSAGLYNELTAFRQLVPNAYISDHANQLPPDPRTLATSNGDALDFDVVNVREGKLAFGTLYDTYQKWFNEGQSPVITAIQSSPPNQIAYGYGYSPLSAALPSTVSFGQNWYPNMRFGLGLTLMNNGYSIYDFGDSSSPVTWWYDEYDFDLGTPAAPAAQMGAGAGPNQIANGGFGSVLAPWSLNTTTDGVGTASVDLTQAGGGGGAAHISVTSAGSVPWHLDFQQGGISLTAGLQYEIQFMARSAAPLTFQISMQGGTAPYSYYGLNGTIVSVGPTWDVYSVYFIAPVTASDGILEFGVGAEVGDLWLDNVQVYVAPTSVYQRDFTNGVVLLNGTSTPQTISLAPGLQRFSGSQAPRDQYIVDDASAAFSTLGTWTVDTFDTGQRVASGPYYHAWLNTLHELAASVWGQAYWKLNVPEDAYYTIQAWLPAAPAASTWTKKATYYVIAGGVTVSTNTVDQSQAAGGDQWVTITNNLYLAGADAPYVLMQNNGSGPMVADALYVSSTQNLYNDGSAVSQVTLAPFDAVLLARLTPNQTIILDPLADGAAGTVRSAPARASSGLPVSLSSNTPRNCSISGNEVSLIAAGICSITARQAGNGSYGAAVPVTLTFRISAPPAAQASNLVFGRPTLTEFANSPLKRRPGRG